MKNKTMLARINLQMYANANTNTTGDADLAPEMKTFYSDYLIDIAKPKLVHDQFGQKKPIPKGSGKTIEFRKYDNLPKSLTPLTEGVTPDGKKMKVTTLSATVSQYGDYITLSDMYSLTAIDDNMVQATKLIGSQAGESLDTIVREILNAGTNVQYGDGDNAYTSRGQLVGKNSTLAEGDTFDYLTVAAVENVVNALKNGKAEKIGDSYVAVIHPDVAKDLMRDPDWRKPHEYVDTENIYAGEIGKVAGVRFVETTEAKIWTAGLIGTRTSVTAGTGTPYAGGVLTVDETLTAGEQTDAVGKTVLDNNGTAIKITAATATTLTLAVTGLTPSFTASAEVYVGGGASKGESVYSTLFIGENAYGTTDITDGGLKIIPKPLGSGDDPLNQRATVGWKATKTAEILVNQYMVRVETVASKANRASN